MLTDIVPSVEARPLGYTAALVLVDALLTESVDDRVVSRWAHVPNLAELARRALEFRELSLRASGSESNISSNIERVRGLLVPA